MSDEEVARLEALGVAWDVQVEQWERKTLLGLQRTTQLIRTFSDMRELAR